MSILPKIVCTSNIIIDYLKSNATLSKKKKKNSNYTIFLVKFDCGKAQITHSLVDCPQLKLGLENDLI